MTTWEEKMKRYYVFTKGISNYGTPLWELDSIQDTKPPRRKGQRVFYMADYYKAKEKGRNLS